MSVGCRGPRTEDGVVAGTGASGLMGGDRVLWPDGPICIGKKGVGVRTSGRTSAKTSAGQEVGPEA